MKKPKHEGTWLLYCGVWTGGTEEFIYWILFWPCEEPNFNELLHVITNNYKADKQIHRVAASLLNSYQSNIEKKTVYLKPILRDRVSSVFFRHFEE